MRIHPVDLRDGPGDLAGGIRFVECGYRVMSVCRQGNRQEEKRADADHGNFSLVVLWYLTKCNTPKTQQASMLEGNEMKTESDDRGWRDVRYNASETWRIFPNC